MVILIISFLELFSSISSMRGEIYEQSVKLDNMLSLWNIQGIFIQGTQAKVPKPSHTNSRDKESLSSSTQAKPSQAKLEEQLEEQHRQGAAVQPYPVIT